MSHPHHLGPTADTKRDAPGPPESDIVQNEYDFSKAERGKFYRPDAVLAPPVHLDPEVLAFLTARGSERRIAQRACQCASEERHRADRGCRIGSCSPSAQAQTLSQWERVLPPSHSAYLPSPQKEIHRQRDDRRPASGRLYTEEHRPASQAQTARGFDEAFAISDDERGRRPCRSAERPALWEMCDLRNLPRFLSNNIGKSCLRPRNRPFWRDCGAYRLSHAQYIVTSNQQWSPSQFR